MIQLVVNGENEFRKPIPISQTAEKTICMLVTAFGPFHRFSVAACSVIGFRAVRPVVVIGAIDFQSIFCYTAKKSCFVEKGKPLARVGRKAMGLSEAARLPAVERGN